MVIEDDLCCSVCALEYDDFRFPRNLNCGHTACSQCLDQIIAVRRHCPECRTVFSADSADKLPINYPLLRLSRLYALNKIDDIPLPELRLPVNSPSGERQQNVGQCQQHGCTLFFMCVTCSVWVCRECVCTDHKDIPMGRCLILSIEKALSRIKESHAKGMARYQEKWPPMKESLESTLKIISLAIRFVENFKDPNILSGTENFSELYKHKENFSTTLSNLTCLIEALNAADEKLRNSDIPDDVVAADKELTSRQLAVDKIMFTQRDIVTPDIISNTLQNVFDKMKDLRKVLKEGKLLYAITESGEQEKSRWAPLTCAEDGRRLHLHALRDGDPPEEGILLPYELIRHLVSKCSPSIFFEVGWGGEVKGTVYVRIYDDTPRGRQTVLLSTGEKGPSYRNTCFYEASRDTPCSIKGGDYENNNGTGGRAIVDGIVNGSPYTRDVKAGLFVSWPSHETYHLGSFDIYLKDEPELQDYSAHGIVDEGLQILLDATEVKPITDTSVMDCGLVIPLE